ncbi:hypothetical protein [Pseudobacteroides cellulosolvens]|uniref:Uncharacterized protein n=1 Tax=Pseudobacteroides cellulosolvens ATCC 35603 = DSM 2933 TaxID=398512 RepID=A0A0L6JIP3_9FIRM|nr:hypothetical protein [Pseudobacteroides cellulosolvens]KNY25614.1 hypothetical protein Bccel_0874 [Pseudobacteroides cellulosolvens ATCC 35603 = DSM 2933]
MVPKVSDDFNGIPNDIVNVEGESGLKLIRFEKEDLEKSSEAADWQIAIGVTETIASVFNIIPALGGYVTPIGVGATVTWGGSNLGSAASAVARECKLIPITYPFNLLKPAKKVYLPMPCKNEFFRLMLPVSK